MNTDKFLNVDKGLGPEMKSTGEAVHFIKDLRPPKGVLPNLRRLYRAFGDDPAAHGLPDK